jgi:hypothetical protein
MIQMKNLINALRGSIRHRAELVQLEAPTAHAKPFLRKKDGAWTAQFHGNDNAQQDRAQQDQAKGRQQHIDESLYGVLNSSSRHRRALKRRDVDKGGGVDGGFW